MSIDGPRDGRVAFLRALIDDAGLFPPSSLPMQQAAEQHRASRSGIHRWMVGRFLCPASRLLELAQVLPEVSGGERWEVSVVLDPVEADEFLGAVSDQLDTVRRFSLDAEQRASVRLIELRLPAELIPDRMTARSTIESTLRALEDSERTDPVVPFLELSGGSDWSRLLPAAIEVIAEVRASWRSTSVHPPGAKIRCGGASVDAFPPPEHVGRFVDLCRRSGVPFKATAGLHHPIRHLDEATQIVQHGFLNVVGAAVLSCAAHLDTRTLVRMIADDQPSSFHLGPDGFRWRESSAGPAAIAAARRELLFAYGSCSFTEPVDDLTALGVLPVDAA